jgi:hypothetical protein
MNRSSCTKEMLLKGRWNQVAPTIPDQVVHQYNSLQPGFPNRAGRETIHGKSVTLKQKQACMKRYALIRAGLIVSLICMAPFSGYSVAAEHLHTSPSQETETSRVVEGAKVTIEYIATVPSSVGIDYGNVSEFIQGQHEIFPVVE